MIDNIYHTINTTHLTQIYRNPTLDVDQIDGAIYLVYGEIDRMKKVTDVPALQYAREIMAIDSAWPQPTRFNIRVS
ncbi:hypothetical protein [Photobacterium sp. TY1-4]|uniref:hypothetical protein n=1 Tax=Photobacterium sp. TY1-4 TaxID=2899122 RepID=UPI0021BFE0E7|nr:hypothetical protein [Photobacterium sp. TY1-4]UXI02497.1 hypothetical protein NH461_06960 [Photobacterium sp. TY1-4]